jgi:hypothetical protein
LTLARYEISSSACSEAKPRLARNSSYDKGCYLSLWMIKSRA